MVKKVDQSAFAGIFSKKTTTSELATPPTTQAKHAGGRPTSDRRVPTSVGLRESELAQLDAITNSLGVGRNAVVAYFVRHAMQEHQAGRINLKSKVTRKGGLTTLAEP